MQQLEKYYPKETLAIAYRRVHFGNDSDEPSQRVKLEIPDMQASKYNVTANPEPPEVLVTSCFYSIVNSSFSV